MAHNGGSGIKGMRKKSNPARKARRARSQGRLAEKKGRRVLKRNGPAAYEHWRTTGKLPVTRRVDNGIDTKAS